MPRKRWTATAARGGLTWTRGNQDWDRMSPDRIEAFEGVPEAHELKLALSICRRSSKRLPIASPSLLSPNFLKPLICHSITFPRTAAAPRLERMRSQRSTVGETGRDGKFQRTLS